MRGCLTISTNILAMLLALGQGAIACLALSEPSGVPEDYRWARMAVLFAAMLLVGNVAALAFMASRKRWLWQVGCVLLPLVAALGCYVVWLGTEFVAKEVKKGGDWGALGVGMAKLFGVAVPLVVICASMVAFATLCMQGRETTYTKAPG